jgi:hypothetical protein
MYNTVNGLGVKSGGLSVDLPRLTRHVFGITLYRVSGVHETTTPTWGLVDWQPVAGNTCGYHPLQDTTESNNLNFNTRFRDESRP